jgi:hypothetical protein
MTIRSAILAACVLMSLASSAECQQPDGKARTYQLKATPKAVAWGHYDAKTPPVLRIKPSEAVEVQTHITNSPARPHATACSTARQTLPHEVRKVEPTSLQLSLLAQLARYQR